MPDLLSFINEIFWDSVITWLLPGAGLWFTFRTGFIQFRYLRQFGRRLKNSVIPQPDGLTPFQALCASLVARVGSGNLAGVALAITAGGPGAIFWMWVSAIVGMATSFAECSLAQLYKERDGNDPCRGGPAWYMSRGLGMRWLGVLFSIFLLLAYGLIFNSVQANSVSHALQFAFDMPKALTGVILAGLVLLATLKGLKRVGRLMQLLIPPIALLWLISSLILCLWYIQEIPAIILLIVESAFGWQEAAAGALGYTISQALTSGFQRGMFSNEAGMGSSPNAAAAVCQPAHPAVQGIIQMAGVFIDTIVICSASAIIVLLAANGDAAPTTVAGIQLLQQSMIALTGNWGAGFVAFFVMLFSFSAIVANYIYAENNLIYLKITSPAAIWTLRICTLLIVFAGTLLSLPLVWQFADIIMALMAMTNLIAILLLSPVVQIIAGDYLRQRRLGLTPVFDPSRYPDLARQLAPGAWDRPPRR